MNLNEYSSLDRQIMLELLHIDSILYPFGNNCTFIHDIDIVGYAPDKLDALLHQNDRRFPLALIPGSRLEFPPRWKAGFPQSARRAKRTLGLEASALAKASLPLTTA